MYGMQGGCVSANACLYALKLDELSIKAQYSFNPSVICFCHSSLRTGALSNADNKAKYELKLFILRRCFMILMNVVTYFSRVLASFCSRIRDLALNKITTKKSPNKLIENSVY